jgi:hypothetical protein
MLLRYSIIGLLAAGLLAAAQQAPPAKNGPRIGLRPGGQLGLPGIGPRIGLKKGRPMGPPPPSPELMDRWRGMSADERQHMVDRLPPERRDLFRRRMEMWEHMRPEERKGMRDRFDRFRDLPPEQQSNARRAFREFNQLPNERKSELRREMNALRGLTEEERTARFNSEEFKSKFDAHERGLMQDLAAALPD